MKLSQLLTINLFVCLSSSVINSEGRYTELLHRRLKMDMEDHSDGMGMGMNKGRTEGGRSSAPTSGPTVTSVTVQPTPVVTLGMDQTIMNLFDRVRGAAPTSSPTPSSTTLQPTLVETKSMGMDKAGMNKKKGKMNIVLTSSPTGSASSSTVQPTVAPTGSATSTSVEPTVAVSKGMTMENMGMNMIQGKMGMGMGRGASLAPIAAPVVSSMTTVQPTNLATLELPTGNIAPTDAPINPTTSTSTPTEAPIPDNVVRIGDHFMSFAAPLAKREPTREEYDEMIERLRDWFESVVSDAYEGEGFTLLSMELFKDFEIYGLNKNIPPQPDDYNIYISFDHADYLFEETDNELPSPADLFKIIKRSITADFILDVVRTYKGTPFESTNEVSLMTLTP